MGTISLTGSDINKLNDRILNDLGDGDAVTISFPNDSVTVKIGKNGNAMYVPNKTGFQVDVVMRVLRGSSDDKFLNQLLALQNQDLAGFTLMNFEFAKRLGDGEGNILNDLNSLSGGVFTKATPDAKDNVEGDTDAALAIYNMKFTRAVRLLA